MNEKTNLIEEIKVLLKLHGIKQKDFKKVMGFSYIPFRTGCVGIPKLEAALGRLYRLECSDAVKRVCRLINS